MLSDSTAAAGRHPAVQAVLAHFRYDHLPPHLQNVSRPCAELAAAMVAALPDDPQLTLGLQDLLRAKDCFVRAALPPPRPGAGYPEGR